MNEILIRTLWLFALPLALSGCQTPPARPDLVRERMGEELAQALNQRPSPQVSEKALLPPLNIELPKVEQAEPRFDLSVVNAPAAQVFMAIVSGTRYNMLVGPEVAGTITIDLKDVTVREALESIRDLYGYEFTIQGNRITIQPNTLQTRVFQVNYLASRRQGATELRVTSSSIAGSTTGTASTPTSGTAVPPTATGGSQAASSLTSQVQTSTDSDFWRELQTSLATIVSGEGRSVVVNGLSGVVVVRGYPAELRAVEQYLKATQVMVERQVMLEAKILEVQLSERFQNGINWASFNGVNHRASVGVLQPGSTLAATGSGSALASADLTALPGVAGSLAATALGNGFVGLAFQTANFAALLSFLETQGQVSVLSSPRIATLNNQKAVLKVGTDELFVTNVTSTTTSTAAGTTSTPNLTLQPYFSGISLDVTPQIDEEGKIILHIHPAVSAVSEKEKVIDLGALGQFKLPLATSSVNETDSIVRVQDGNIVAIGGLMTQSQTSNRNGLPGTVSSPAGVLFGQRGSSLEKRELVILLKPTIIRDDRAWLDDLRQSGERLRNFDLPPLTVPLQ
ncbi:secretin N-terminal domain-containing protein [Sulfuricystis multivorans]|uniref:secretin N-terminal domain-containing protein n=1 Tax=Sulfuricystis multivorans TaxID=2211108 RepID=UPI000F828FBC|nr:secretin N-terminal domain-containing protein [Sulfuricystis multivorans]